MVSSRLLLSNRALKNFTPKERLQYFSELKESCNGEALTHERKFVKNTVSAISSRIRNYSFSIQEAENIPCSKNALFVANHTNAHDFFTTQETFSELRLPITFLASCEDISSLIVFIFQSCNGVLIDRKDPSSIDKGILQFMSNIASGLSGVIFSESTWNLHPYKPMLPIKAGAALIAATLEIPIVPIIYEYVEVPYLCKKESEIYSRCVVRFGAPIHISQTEDLILQTDKIQSTMENMRITLWKELCINKASLSDVSASLYGNHTWLRKFGTGAEYDSQREMQFILTKNGQPTENEYCINNAGNLVPGIIKKSERKKYI